jgi:hypothetical protein
MVWSHVTGVASKDTRVVRTSGLQSSISNEVLAAARFRDETVDELRGLRQRGNDESVLGTG